MSNKVTNLLSSAFSLQHPPTHHNPNAARTTEQTPLLAASADNPITQADSETLDIHKIGTTNITTEAEEPAVEDEDEDKPLPIGQIMLLCYARLVEPIAFFSIFPFINQMILEVGGVREEDVGFYSGLIVSIGFFSLRLVCG